MFSRRQEQKKHAWVVAVDMGYGHQRAAYPLRSIAEGGRVFTANNYDGIPYSDRVLWEQSEKFYNFISRFRAKGFFGRIAFDIFDYFQRIDEYYPFKKGVRPTLQLKQIYRNIGKGWGKHLINELRKKPLPLITPFFTIAFMAEHWKYPGSIYLIVTDADISRAWAPLASSRTRITYFASTPRSALRLEEYGVPAKNILYTGFPLPEELVGKNSKTAKDALSARLSRLDPRHIYRNNYKALIESHLGAVPDHPAHKTTGVTLMFSVGGAGAQTEIGEAIIKSAAPLVEKGILRLILVAGVSRDASDGFLEAIHAAKLESHLDVGVRILIGDTKEEYFEKFNEALRTTDILWTKPSELSFYGALGIPIIIAPPVGSQEIQNRKWLLYLGAGVDQMRPEYLHEWLPDLIESGRLAQSALEGFIKMEREGTSRILSAVGIKKSAR